MSTQKRIPGFGNKNNNHANDQGNDSYNRKMYGSSLNSNYSNVNYSSSPLSSSNGFQNSSYMNNMSGVSGNNDTLEVSGSSVVSTGTMNKKISAASGNQFNMNRPISPFQGYPSVYSNKSETSLLSNTSGSSLYNSKGLIYSLKTNKELSSIDKINDPQSNTLIVAGKSHMGLYRFENNQGQGTIRLVKDVFGSKSLNNNTSTSSTSFTSSSLNASKKKKMNHMLSTISDVKAGFNHYSNYVAITGTSTSVSLYDVKRSDTPLVANFAEHTRSINSLDFHMGDQQSHMLITGGQDGTIKIWDLRTLSLNRMSKSDISINTMSESIRDVKWCPVWSRSENHMGNNLDLNISTNGLHSSGHNMGGLAAHQTSSTSLSSFTLQSNTLQASSQYLSTSSNDGNYFASIHDSGNLLKYDLRNYSQPERKLNAHSGPGLCLNWHPSGEYIITGGRDGKLCFWFVGEGKPNLFPEQVINVGSPISKLKFQPTLKNNHKNLIMNSNFAMSPLGDNSAVSVYNLSNKYIPKTVLTSGQNSLGFVWWDENLIFNIDQKNKINGWDMSKETEQVTNMRKNSLKWRDIEGDGVVFVSQNQNLPTTSTPAFNTQTDISSPAPYSNSKSLSPIINYKNRHRMSSATVSSFLNNRNNSATSSNSQPGTHTTSPTQILRNSDTAFQQHGKSSMLHSLTQPSLRRTQSGFSYNQNSSLLTPNTNSSYGNGPGYHHNGSIGSQNAHLGSILSNHSNTISVTDPALLNCFQSPKILTLDLPYIFNTIRKNKIISKRENADSIKLSFRLKESPTEVFKFLARELKFSFLKEIDDQLQLKYLQEKKHHLEQDRQINKNKEAFGSLDDKTEEQVEEKDRKDLMERLGISNTWSQLTTSLAVKPADINNNNEVKSDHVANTPNPGKPASEISNDQGSIAYKTSHNNLAKTERTVSTSSIFSDSNSREQAKNLSRMTKEQKQTDFVNNLMESIAISEHNAETYLYIEDLTNFKLWIMIRDSLLWRLKKLMSGFEEGSEMLEKIKHFMSKSKDEDTSALIDPDTVVARVEPTDVAEVSSEYHYESDSENGDTSSFQANKKLTKNGSFSGSLQSRAGSFDYEYRLDLPARKESKSGSDNSAMKSALDDVRSNFKKHVTVADENVISDNDEEDDLFAVKKDLSSAGEKPIEMLNRRKSRTSFVDTMMSSLRSGKMDIDDEFSKRKNSVNPLLSRAPTFSLTTPSPHSSATSSLLTREIRGKSIDENISRNNFMNKVFPENSISGQNESFDLKVCEPWAPEILIKKIYNQAVDTGNVLLSINILLLFQSQFNITSSIVVKNAVHEFMNILHTYELFEVSAELLKYCPWGEEILSEEDSSTGQSAVCLYCDKCGKVLVNESSKKKHIELQDKEIKFGYWYCDRCKKPNTLCALCEKPIKKLAVAALECGHVGHPECFTKWFVNEQMEQCPKGCIAELLTI